MTEAAGNPRGCRDDKASYEIRLQGHLDPRWADRMDGLAFILETDGTTTLSGPLADQSALHGLLNRVRDLGLPIVSVRRLGTSQEEEKS